MTKEQQQAIHAAGEKVARQMTGFYGSVQINIQDGKYVNSNIQQSLKPEKQKVT